MCVPKAFQFYNPATKEKKRSFKRKIVFKKVAFGLWVDTSQGESWLPALLEPLVNTTKQPTMTRAYLGQGVLQPHAGIS